MGRGAISSTTSRGTANATMTTKRTWIMFWDLQCPFARKTWQHYADIQAAFVETYDFSIHLTALPFHRQAFPAMCAAKLIEQRHGTDARWNFINACYERQHLYTKDAVGDKRPSEINEIFAQIAQDANLLDDDLTRDVFLDKVNDWDEVVRAAWLEHKMALEQGVFGTPKHVIDGQLVLGTESDWGVPEWTTKLAELNQNKRMRMTVEQEHQSNKFE